MGLVYRNGRPYLYRSVRRGGRVTSEYVASGIDALLIDRLEGVERDKRDYEAWLKAKRCQEADEIDRMLDDVWRGAEPWPNPP